jgi:hypothetical protein
VKTGAALVAVAAIISSMAGALSREEAVVPDVVGVHIQSAYGQLRSAGFAIQIDEPIDLSASVSHQSVAGERGLLSVVSSCSSSTDAADCEDSFLGTLRPYGCLPWSESLSLKQSALSRVSV